MKKLIENNYSSEKFTSDKILLNEFPFKTTLRKSGKLQQSNESIINYGRFVETNRSKSKYLKAIDSTPFYYSKSKRFATNQQVKSITDRSIMEDNSNYTERLNTNPVNVQSTIEIPSKHQTHVLSLEKTCSYTEMDSYPIYNRKRYKSVDNRELQKLVQAKSNQSPNEIRATVNRWLKDTLPTIVLNDNEANHEGSIFKDSLKSKSNVTPTTTRKLLKKEIQNLELCCRELLSDSNFSRTKSQHNALKFYDLLHNLYVSLQKLKIKHKKLNSTLENNPIANENSNKNEILEKEKLADKISKKINDTELNNLDVVTRSGNKSGNANPTNQKPNNLKVISTDNEHLEIPQKRILPSINKRKSLKNVDLVKSIEKELKKTQPVLINTEKILIGELLTLPKVEIKSKCVVGIYKNFIEEQYVITGFRKLSKEDREMHLNRGISPKTVFLNRLVHLTTSCLENCNKEDQLNFHQEIQTEEFEFDDRLSQSLQNVASQTSNVTENRLQTSVPKINITKDDEPGETLSWQSENPSNDDLNYKSENEIHSPIMFEDELNDLNRGDITDAISYFEEMNQYNKYNSVKNQKILQQATIEYSRIPSFRSDHDITEISAWTAHASRVKVFYNHAIENPFKYLMLMGNTFQNPKHLEINSNKVNFKKCLKLSYNEKIPIKTCLNDSLPPCGPSAKCNKLQSPIEDESSKKRLSVLEVNCQEIKDSLEKDIPLPENLNNLYERLSKLQKILEGIPDGNMDLTVDAFDQLNSSESCSPEFISKYDYSYLHYLDKDQCPTSLGDCTENVEVPELPEQNLLKISSTKTCPNVKGDPNSPKEQINETNFEDEQSDVTNSLSMLENLIDDFLLKNGLTNNSKF